MRLPRILGGLLRWKDLCLSLHPRNVYCHLYTQPVPEETLRSHLARPEQGLSNPPRSLREFAVAKDGLPFTKWWHYFEVYESRLGTVAQQSRESSSREPLRILEIGVWRGGSLELWRQYFGPHATIFGIDVDESCRDIPQTSAQIRVGSQVDRDFLESVVNEMGGIDIVIDDGSHLSQHVIESFKILFPLLADDGYYLIEDLHTSYWPRWGGGLRRRNSSIEFLKSLIDELHTPYFRRRPRSKLSPREKSGLRSIELFDSMALIRKGKVHDPQLFFGGNLSD